MRSLEKIIKDFNLILNNKSEAIIRLEKKTKESIINLMFITIELGLLDL